MLTATKKRFIVTHTSVFIMRALILLELSAGFVQSVVIKSLQRSHSSDILIFHFFTIGTSNNQPTRPLQGGLFLNKITSTVLLIGPEIITRKAELIIFTFKFFINFVDFILSARLPLHSRAPLGLTGQQIWYKTESARDKGGKYVKVQS